MLLAFSLFGKGTAKQTSPGAIIIQFFDGMSGVFSFSLFGAGLVAPASPESIFAISAMAPKGGLLAIFTGVIIATAITFFITAAILKTDKSNDDDLGEAKEISKNKKREDTTGTKIKKNIYVWCW
ncbi:MAG: hypothetical protein ACRC5R_00800 [Mycoplasmatales bacterium]